jgi:hypothetical protein
LTPGDTERPESYVQLESALVGLLYQSESDYPLEFVCWAKKPGKALDSNFVCEQLGKGQDANVQEADAQTLLEDCCKIETWFDERERAVAQGFQKLRNLLNQLVRGLRQFRVGEIEVTVVVVGEDERGNIVGFKTISIET